MATRAHPDQKITHSTPRTGEGKPFLLREAGGDEGGSLSSGTLFRETAEGTKSYPIIDPRRTQPTRDFRRAWHYANIVLRDKDETEKIVYVIDALPWLGQNEAATAFLSTPRGQKIFADEPFLPDFLDDREALRKTPKGSFAHAYCDFMDSENLTATEIVESTDFRRDNGNNFDDGVAWYINRLRDYHDILHIVTGYGRDTLGELCVFAYMFGQRPSHGHYVLSWGGALKMRWASLTSRAPIIGALWEARQNGKACPPIVEMPIHELFAKPLEEVRAMLGAPEPKKYKKVLETFEKEGINPHTFLKPQD